MWLNNLQIAIIEKDAQRIGELVKEKLEFDNIEDIEKAQYLLAEAAKLVDEMREETSQIMKKLRKNREFLDSTSSSRNQKLDVRY